MARRVFFSFHYGRDIWRANQVRNSWVTKPDRVEAGFWNSASWEEVKKKGEEAIKRWIDKQLEGTSVTAVLIGAETSNRDYVKYELEKSWKRGNGILGIYIHQMKDKNGNTDTQGSNTFGPIFISPNDERKYFFERFLTYDWVDNHGHNKFGDWVEAAAKKAGKQCVIWKRAQSIMQQWHKHPVPDLVDYNRN
jgi:hypothetical protein